MIHPYYDVVQFKCDSMQYDPMEKKYGRFYFFGSDRQQNIKLTCLLTSNASRPVS